MVTFQKLQSGFSTSVPYLNHHHSLKVTLFSQEMLSLLMKMLHQIIKMVWNRRTLVENLNACLVLKVFVHGVY